MKAIILAAGKGTRMGELSQDLPKVLIELNGKPFLYYIMKNLSDAGFTDICLVVGYKKEKIIDFLEEYSLDASLVEQTEQKGTGHALIEAKDFAGDENFLVINGDNLFSPRDLKQLLINDSLNYMIGKKVDDPSKFGVLVVKDDLLIRIVEKPKDFVGDLVNLGVYKFTNEIWDALEKVKLSERGEYELTDAITELSGRNKVKVIKLSHYWLHLGNQDDIPLIEEELKKYNL